MSLKILSAVITAVLASATVFASSHREAPFITELPKSDGTDFYMFRSYETGREGFVTILANYLPLQDPYGGPNYFFMDQEALYEIHVDNNGDAQEDLTFQFRFNNAFQSRAIPVNGTSVPVPLINIGPFGPTPEANDANKNLIETYTVNVVRGNRRTGTVQPATNASAGTNNFRKPFDYIGTKSIPAYQQYADNHIFRLAIPGCAEGRVFVGQRREGFFIDLGGTFDLVNLNPLGPREGGPNQLLDKNVTTLALEVPIACLAAQGSPIVGAWTTSSLRQARVLNSRPRGSATLTPTGATGVGPSIEGGAWTQISRLGAPLVNEVVIGLPDKDRFNASEPRNDAQFGAYVTSPTFPELLEILFPAVTAPNQFPRTDLVSVFLTGVAGLNMPTGVAASEMLRLNTGTAPVAAGSQNDLGVIGGDNAGYPNGRRPGDDVVDITLRAAMGVLLPAAAAPSGQLPFTDGVRAAPGLFRTTFPYLNTPLPGKG